jgi:hypothetical protein
MNEAFVRRGLRAVALLIAVVAANDPAITSRRSTKPTVIVTALDSSRDARVSDNVARTIDNRFTVSRSPIAGAAAAVLVGDGLPDGRQEFPGPSFIVVSDTSAPRVAIERIDTPERAPSDARIPVVVHLAMRSASELPVDVTLRVGNTVAERVTRRVGRGESTLVVPMTFVAPARGANRVTVSVALTGTDASAIGAAAVDVDERRWTVLFHDPRPSWTSTFVRRAIERDSRFMVASRVVTSRNVSASAGRAPAGLTDRRSLSAFDVVVVGAPDALSASDVASLEDLMRRRGGSVVLLVDELKPGPIDRLTNVPSWSTDRGSLVNVALAQDDSATLRAGEIAWPSALPAGAVVIAGGQRPVIWESAVGGGRLLVSGALDAWRYRDPSVSGFDRFWRTLIAGAATSAPPAVSVNATPSIAKPGESVDVNALVRDAALRNPTDPGVVRASISATLEPSTSVRLLPDAEVGQFTGALRAPREPGTYNITVISDVGTATVPLVVSNDIHHVQPSSRDLSRAWATSRGGQMFQASELGRLPEALSAAIRSPSELITWHPLRSAWWIVPFVLALSGDWWLRRRRGLR